jgi:D-amino peptidase
VKVFLLTDLEGIAGVESIEQMDRTGAAYAAICRQLERTINIAVETCVQNGADVVYYLDGHGGGGNIRPEAIDPRAIRCENIHRWNELVQQRVFDCQIELGAHARAGTMGGFLDHTLNSREFFSIRHNGKEMSELSMHATLCAKYGIPVVAVTGDEAACLQAREYIPGIFTGAVKVAHCRNEAKTYPNADEILRDTVAQGLRNWQSVPLIPFSEPVTVEQTFCRADYCEEALKNSPPDTQRLNARTLLKKAKHIALYKELKF